MERGLGNREEEKEGRRIWMCEENMGEERRGGKSWLGGKVRRKEGKEKEKTA